ncbi:MAG TPA: glycine cleavage system protein GcvH [Candidatus Competibacteraceae bacterium]|nr:glycine cleavage system protein GcvH [Candidatus Competibacteraceae bacterium]
MSELKYTFDHEWVRLDDEGLALVGITGYAQEQLGDLVFVELPAPGRELGQGEAAAVVESVKSASDVLAPMAGTVVAVNERLADDPALVNREPEGGGWLFKLRPANVQALAALMDEADYRAYLAEQG